MSIKPRPLTNRKTVVLSLIFTAAFALALIVATFASGGAGLAARSATDLAMPVGLVWLLFFAGFAAGVIRRKRWMATGCLFLFLAVGLLFNGRVASFWVQSVEFPASGNPAEALTEKLDAVVLLGGYAGVNRFDVPEVGRDGQRLVLTAQLWHSGKARTLICTGTGHSVYTDPSQIGREMLTSLGVPNEVIFEVRGDNTSEEMKALREFFSDPPDSWTSLVNDRENESPVSLTSDDHPAIGLVTSAFHLPRANRLAKEQNLNFISLPCCFRGSSPEQWTARELIPSAAAGDLLQIALKETLARIVGR